MLLLLAVYYSQVSSEGRDPGLTINALNQFKLIVTKFPETKYAKDSKLKIQFLQNTLARNELNIGKFYLKKGAPASAIRRFKFILQNYQNTSAIPQTLFRLSEALLLIGLKEEAKKSAAILNYNFSDNKWTNISKDLFENEIEFDQKENSKFSITNFFKNIF